MPRKHGMTVAELTKFIHADCPEVVVHDTVQNRNRYHLPLKYIDECGVSIINEQIP